ncbi:MAG: metal-dependent hydrolase [Gammaproteobacteria bacterium]|nr:metal-dependent hydrolase [Gammaproteobacteria bacterium]
MDAVTHALLGATAACATAPRDAHLARREWISLGALAAAFPDIDFAGFPFDPLRFLAHWHQGPTHSLVLLPLFALLIAATYVTLTRRPRALAAATAVCALGIATHVASDLITAYGTMLLYPFSDRRWALGITYLLDPLFTALVAISLVVALATRQRLGAWIGLGATGLYVATQFGLQQHALELGRVSAAAQGLPLTRLDAIAQPFSPFNWKLIASAGTTRHQAHVNLGGPVSVVPLPAALDAVAEAYDEPMRITWRRRDLYGRGARHRSLTATLWNDPRFADYRRFATHPALARIDGETPECVWFTDLRYDLPRLPETFRYGFCRAGGGEAWQLYRLRYFSNDARQRLAR